MNQRLKELRISLNLSQEEFGKKINLSKPTISAFENATRGLTDRVVSDICQQFNISEMWLRSGCGNMFLETDKTIISALVDEYELDPLDQKIVECYLNLGAIQRKVIKGYLRSLVDAMLADDTYDEYWEQRIEENPDRDEENQRNPINVFPYIGADDARKSEENKEIYAEEQRAALHAKLDEELAKEKKRESKASSAKESDVG